MRWLLSILIIILLCSSCKKDQKPKTTVSGFVSNRLTAAKVKNIPVEIVECDGIPSKCLTTLQTTYTDVNGYYSTSFRAEKGKSYTVAVAPNHSLANIPYPYYLPVKVNMDNKIDFQQFPLKILKLHIIVRRHDKNWLNIHTYDNDSNGFLSYGFYDGANLITDFEQTQIYKVEAGRAYRTSVVLSNKVAPYTYQDQEIIYKNFSVANVDTTVVDFIIP